MPDGEKPLARVAADANLRHADDDSHLRSVFFRHAGLALVWVRPRGQHEVADRDSGRRSEPVGVAHERRSYR